MVKQESVIKVLKKTDDWSPALEGEIKQATSMEEIEELVMLFHCLKTDKQTLYTLCLSSR
jgi:hypothetical protein